MKKKMMLLLTFLLIGIGLVTAQVKEVKGTVTSTEDGQPVIGASVVVKGTTLGTVTDANGKFALKNIPASAKTIFVSYIGMRTKEVNIQPVLVIKLDPDNAMLDEVVVTAMGISKEKKALGYAVQDVKGDKLTQAANSSLSGALQGKVSGIDIVSSSGMPGASSKITIRGSRSFTGDNTPLYVIDGMPVSSGTDLSTFDSVTGCDYANRSVDIDPNDIESINILKGQAASALYGMRASNGVIIITTKSGKHAQKGKPTVTYTMGVSFDTPSTLPEFQKEFAQGLSGNYKPTASTSWGPKISELANDPTYGGNTDNNFTKQYGLHKGQYYVQQRANAGLDPWATPRAYDNAKDFYRTGSTWNNSVNVTQRLDRGSYSLSLGSSNAKGIVPSTGLDRYNAKFTGEALLNKHWSTGFSSNFTYSVLDKQSSANNGVIATVYGAPTSYDLKGIPAHVKGDPYKQNTYRSTGGFDGPYWATENNKFEERSQRFFGNAYAQYETTFGDHHHLVLKYQLGADAYTTSYTDNWGYGHSNKDGQIEEQTITDTEINSLFTANYDWKINEDLDFNLMYGNEFVESGVKYKDATGNHYNFAGWNHMNNAKEYTASSSYTRNRTVGNFANLSLSYKDMLFLNATVRNDIVSSMPRNNRSFTYPSVSLGWIFTQLPALKNNVLTYGKVRASYAEVGQAGTYYPSYYYTPSYGGGFYMGIDPITYPVNGVTAYIPYWRIYDPDLRPQNTRSYEFGVDLNFWNGLISLNYTYSRQNVKDQIFPVPLDTSLGYQEMMTNGGKVHTNAHEATLTFNPIRKKNVNWDFGFNFTKIDNYVDELAPGVESIMLGGFVDPQVRLGIGDKYPVIYGTSYLRNEKGQIVVDEDGLPQGGENKVIGTVSPDFRLGISTNLELYKFKLSAVLDWKKGGEMYVGTASVMNFYGTTKKSADYRKKKEFLFEKPAVKQNADGSYSPNDIKIKGEDAFFYFNAMSSISEAGVYGTSFLKLREIALSYPVVDKKGLKLTANVFARNLLLWSEMDNGIDPESSQGNTNMSGAFERFSLPGTSSYGFGLTVKF